MILTVLCLALVSSCLAQQPADKNAQHQRPVREPQGQIQYSNPDGLKVNWKLYGPENQAESRRSQRAETSTNNANYDPKNRVVQAPIEQQPHYQPFSAVPNHIKQLLIQAYSPQGPYVDPGAFFYKSPGISTISSLAPQSYHEKSASTQISNDDRSYFDSAIHYQASTDVKNSRSSQFGETSNKIGGIKYKNEDRVRQRSAELPYGSVIPTQSPSKTNYQPYKQIQQSQTQSQPQHDRQIFQPQSRYQQNDKQIFQSRQTSNNRQYVKQNSPSLIGYQKFDEGNSQPHRYQPISESQTFKPISSQTNYERDMSLAIRTLLKYQAQLPYNVIANHIHYRPKEIFVPKPLPENAKFSGNYPSKIYFVKTNGEIYDGPEINKNVKYEKRY